MSLNNIVDIQLVESGLGVRVSFSVNHGRGTRTYEYSSLEAVRGILAGEDPASWSGIRVDDESGSGGGAASGIGAAIEDAVIDLSEI